MEKLKTLLLVDDSRATNFFNKTMIEKVGCAEEVIVAENGKEALQYLQSGISPEIIFLDINMPVMDGWEFLSEYQKLQNKQDKSIIVLMLGASLSSEKEKLARSIPEIKEFREKMLSKKIVSDIITKYFGQNESEVYTKNGDLSDC
ncbi:response regulator [Aquimarina sp. 2201CG5-10]|uniref:response regulator n=1 Tax=Aquimarina callyspongiae TaxID=3098150 RepID=UPI002AB54821|nr:response regulator [Aquimarina sp. 2201CG5-10]MDY8138008.1 response regulator [Aquimarina sp. 2201CG5-10]